MKKIIINRNIIRTDAFEEIAMHPELPIILFTSGDLYYETVLQIPMTFTNRFFAREAMERIGSGIETVDLTDMTCEWPAAAAEEIISYLDRLRKEREEYDSVQQTGCSTEKDDTEIA